MKKIISVFLTAVMMLSMIAAVIPASAAGTPLDVSTVGNTVVTDANRAQYTVPDGAIAVSDANGLKNLENDKYYYLTADVTLGADETATFASGVSVITGITLDGCGYKLTLNNASLFSRTKNITVKNITFDGAITANNNSNYHILNSQEAQGYTNLENITASVDFNVTNKTKGKNVGALSINVNSSTVKNVLNEGNVTVNSATTVVDAIGAMFGTANKTAFTNVVNKGTLTVGEAKLSAKTAIGGIVGYATDSTFTNCVNSGAISSSASTDELYIGGITAYIATRASFEGCSNSGNLTVGTNGKVTGLGGIVGMTSGESAELSDCANSGIIAMLAIPEGQEGNSAATSELGDIGMGIAGILGVSRTKSVSLLNCSNSKNITTISKGKVGVGGILGYQYCKTLAQRMLSIEGCTNSGSIEERGEGAMLGGIVGGIRAVENTIIQESQNSGNITISGSAKFAWSSTAGICGFFGTIGGSLMNTDRNRYCEFDIYCCTNTGNISNLEHAGGILARNEEMSGEELYMTIYNCLNQGAISSNGGDAAGIYAYPNAKGHLNMVWCVNEGNITSVDTGVTSENSGGIIASTGAQFSSITISKSKNSGAIVGGDNAGGIASRVSQTPSLPEYGKVLFEDCYNEGTVHASSKNPGMAGGIVAYSKSEITIKNSINKGAVSSAETTTAYPITHEMTVLSKDGSGYYLSGCATATAIQGGEAKNATQIGELVATMVFHRKNNPYNLSKIYEQAKGLYPQDHTTDSWVPMATVFEKATKLINDPEASQADMDNVVAELKAAINGLVLNGVRNFEKLEIALLKGEEAGKEWYSFTWLELFVAMRDARILMNLKDEEMEKVLQSDIDKAEQRIYKAIEVLLEKPPLQGSIDVDQKGQFTLDTLRPEGTTPSGGGSSSNTESSEPLVDMSGEIELGCTGLVGGGAIVLTAIIALATGTAKRRKED